MVYHAYGKINLGLDVLRRLENGYHEVKMVMQSVALYDELTFEITDEQGVFLTTSREELPCDDSNLITIAAKLLLKERLEKRGVRIHLEKRIPMAAGMAGGSADAAATLVAVNNLFELGYSIEELKKIGVTLGADIPFCIEGGTQLSEGIGEILTKLPAFDCRYVLIAKPDIDVSTKYVYENLHVDTLQSHPDVDGMVRSICAGDFAGVLQTMGNVLETVTEKKYPVIKELKDLMIQSGASNSMMSGSGPTVFGLFQDENSLSKAYESVKLSGLAETLEKTTTVNKGNGVEKVC